MLPYAILAASPILIDAIIGRYYVGDDSVVYKKKAYFVVTGFVLFLFIALRSQYVGSADSSHYYARWQRSSEMDWNVFIPELVKSSLEKGYLLFTWGGAHIFPHPQFAFVSSAAVYSISVSRFIYKNSSDDVLSYVMYISLGLFVFMIQGMRQALAMSICLFAIEYCKEKKLIKFLLTVFLATLFHQTAICFILVYFLYGKNLSAGRTTVTLLLGALLVALSGRIISTANDFFDREYTMVVNSGGFVATVIYLIIVTLELYKLLRHKDENELVETFFWNLSFLGLIVYVMRYTAAHAAQRISFYYMFAQMISLPDSFSMFNEDSQKMLRYGAIILSIALFLYRLRQEGFIPYYFFWQR